MLLEFIAHATCCNADALEYDHASFFTGIGGFDLGFERAGMRTVFQCETKAFCRQVLEVRFPGIPKANDIRTVNHATIPDAHVWSGGFPCQDLSLARMGPRSGLRGGQSRLFYDFVRLMGERKPRAIVLENVHGLLSSHGGRDFPGVLKALDELGYGVAWRVLNSKDFGVPQSRRRVYVVGMYRDPRGAGKVLLDPKCSARDAETRRLHAEKPISPFKKILGDPVKGPLVKGIAHCIYAESARHTGTDWSRNYAAYPDGRVRRFTPREVERILGFPADWTLPPNYDESQHGEGIDSKRYHSVGNAVTVNVAEWIGRRLVAVLANEDIELLKRSVGPHERQAICA